MSFDWMLHYRSITALLPTLLIMGLVGCEGAQAPQESTDEQSAEATEPQAAAADQPEHLANAPRDPRAALTEALGAGLLDNDLPVWEDMREVLRVAGVPEASQVLVFSKTSLQHQLIGPRNPRAIYFNDDCYIGYVPGGVIEYGDADEDTDLGSGFYAIDPTLGAEAQLVSDRSCLSCHEGSRTNYRPGFLIRSIFPDPDGHVITSAGSTLVTHDTPIDKRWGGWYVTGQSGDTHHRGNQIAIEHPNGDAFIDNELGSNVEDLSHHFSLSRYLEPTSDIVALMVLEHQVQMHNLLTQGSTSVHEQTERSKSLAKHLEEPFIPENNETLQRVISANAERIVKHLLFCDEVELTSPISGSEKYIEQFRANRKEDAQGRSLKDFDLQTRMFKYRCSYMVYSRAFELMPELLMEAVVAKLHGVLSGNEVDEAFAHLGANERRAILSILRETTDLF